MRPVVASKGCNLHYANMKVLKPLAALILLSVALLADAATVMSVKGIVASADGAGEPYATVRVFAAADSVKPAALCAAADDGSFSVNLAEAGDYRLVASAVGRESAARQFSISSSVPVVNLGTITLADRSRELGEVTVTAQRPLVVKEIDRLGYDVEADPDSRTGTVQDILRKVPLVTVEADGTIKVAGSSNFKIYRNGRPNNSFTKNAKDIFAAIPASTIKKIEVITDPGAREDAEGVGAILNIVTLQNAVIKGVTGNVSLKMKSSNSFIPTPTAYLTTQLDKVTLSAYGNIYTTTEGSSRHATDYSLRYSDSGNLLSSRHTTTNHGQIGWWGLDGSYELDSLNLFTVEVQGWNYGVKANDSYRTLMTDPLGEMVYGYDNETYYPRYSYLDLGGSFNYQHSTHRQGETLTASYQVATTGERQTSNESYTSIVGDFPVGYIGIDRDYKGSFAEHTFQVDWSRPFGSIHKLDIGGKYIYRRNHGKTTTDYNGDSPVTDFVDFYHTTNVGALYADYRVKLKRWSLRGGLRYEYSRMAGRYESPEQEPFASHFNDWAPNAAVSYEIDDASTIKLSYSTRISRPGISYLNPSVTKLPTSVSSGNPRLESATYRKFNLNYGLIKPNFNLDMTLGYSQSGDDIIPVRYAEGSVQYSSYANAGRTRGFSANAYAQWTLTPKTQLLFNGGLSHDYYSNPDALTGADLTNRGWSGSFFARLTQRLPWKLRASASLSYWSGWVSDVYSSGSRHGCDAFDHYLTLDRSFLKNDRLTVAIQADNPFGPYTYVTRQYSRNSGLDGVSRVIGYRNSAFTLKVALRFGSLNAQVKKTDKSIDNDDLVGRKVSK